jgi:uncharacterized protein
MPATLRCPICNRKVSFDDPNMPFCSDRCRVIDLGNWASETYRVESTQKNELESPDGLDGDEEGSRQ